VEAALEAFSSLWKVRRMLGVATAAILVSAAANASLVEMHSSALAARFDSRIESGGVGIPTVQPAAELAQPPASGRDPGAPVPIAIIDFDYQDSAGEPRDQNAEHRVHEQAAGPTLGPAEGLRQ
jgi:hypothetical protein